MELKFVSALFVFAAASMHPLWANSDIPERIVARDGAPLWTSLHAKTGNAVQTGRTGVEDNDAGCRGIEVSEAERDQRTSLEQITRDAIAIFAGEVDQVEPGFHANQPGSLIHFHVADTLKSSRAFDTANGLSLFVPHARFWMNGTKYCSGLSPLPIRTGDRLVVYAFFPPLDAGREFVTDASVRYFVAGPEGNLRKLGVAKTANSIVDQVRTFDRLLADTQRSCVHHVGTVN